MFQCFEDSVWASFQAGDVLNNALQNIYGIQDAIMVLNNKQLHIMKYLDEVCLGMREQTMGKE